MPARNERIYLCPQAGQPVQVVDFPLWWDRRGFFETFGDRAIDLGNPLYVDDALLLTSWEARAWDKKCREAFAQDPSSERPHMVLAMERLQSALESAKWVIVESYEWESGLD